MKDFDEKTVRRFWSYVAVREENQCWPWQGIRSQSGYGLFSRRGKRYVASRVSCELATGVDPGELHVLHSCDNPPCCNPRHLRAGTVQENMREKVERGRQPRGETHPSAKLTVDAVVDIRTSHAAKSASLEALAKRYRVSLPTIIAVVEGRTWATVGNPELARSCFAAGAKFGELTLLSEPWQEPHGRMAACTCACGKYAVVRVEHIRSGRIGRCKRCSRRRFEESRRITPAVVPRGRL